MPRRMGYLAEAAREFLDNLPCRTPAEAVEAGVRSVEEWCACLVRARLACGLNADDYAAPLNATPNSSTFEGFEGHQQLDWAA
jgi:hypothetical protein